jgi:hypothetical protein
MRFVFILIALAVAGPAHAQARPPLTVSDALNMLLAHKALDGRQVVAKQNGQDVVVVVPWEFNSGVLRVRVARNVAALSEVEKLADEARLAIIKEVLKQAPPDKNGRQPATLAPGSAEMDEFLRQYTEVLKEPAKGSEQLARIKVADLRLDRNEIPVTVLSALLPILDE